MLTVTIGRLDRYKARAAFESVLGYLDERHAAQVDAGLTSPSGKDAGK